MASQKPITQLSLIIEFFKANPNRDILHTESKAWLESEFLKRTGKNFGDPDRGIRTLHQTGFLIKVKKGVYKYDPDFVKKPHLEDFSAKVKQQIFERDNFKCVVCGNGPNEGFAIHADHIKAKDKGGQATLDNGQTLCGPHNFFKKTTAKQKWVNECLFFFTNKQKS